MDLAEAGTGPRGYPAQNKTTFVDNVTGIRTEILCSSYSDTHFVVITQKEKFGTMIQAWAETTQDGGKFYSVNTLLGRRDDPLLNVYARQIIENISASSSLPLLLSVCLEDNGRTTRIFQGILNELYSVRTW